MGAECGGFGSLTVVMGTSFFTQSHQSKYKTDSPQGETIFHSDYNEREERGAGNDEENTNSVFSCILPLVSVVVNTQTSNFMLPRLSDILSVHHTLNQRKCVAADRVTLKNMFLTVQRTCVAAFSPLLALPLISLCHI